MERVQQEREKVSLQRRLGYASVAAGDVVARLVASGFLRLTCAMLAAGRMVGSFSTEELQTARAFLGRVVRVRERG